jgi:hypothetical protein
VETGGAVAGLQAAANPATTTDANEQLGEMRTPRA